MTATPARSAHYDAATLQRALLDCGVTAGDILFSHVSMGMLGFPAAGRAEEDMFSTIFSAVRAAIGPEGTWVVPTYTYSLCRNERFDPGSTPSSVGPFTERFRRRPETLRSRDPIFSVAAIGRRAGELLEDLPPECFGADCIYDRLVQVGAKICNIGVGFRTVTFVHYTEQRLGAPYRFLKAFHGDVVVDGAAQRQQWLYNVGVLHENTTPDLHELERTAAATGAFRTAQVGRGAVTVFTCAALDQLAEDALRANPWALAQGPAIDLVASERERLGEPAPRIVAAAEDTLASRVHELSALPAHPLSRACEAGLHRLVAGLPAVFHSFDSGSRTSDGVVQEAWYCRAGFLETLAGKRLLSLEDDPLHVPYYSAKFSGEVSREELLPRLHIHWEEDLIPALSLLGQQTWGLACSGRFKATLFEPRYRVAIDAQTAFGQLQVAEVVVPGRGGREIVLLAAADHGGLANEGLSAAVVATEAARRLLSVPPGETGLRLLIGPRCSGQDVYFRRYPWIRARLEGIVALESLGINAELHLQVPRGAGLFARRCEQAMKTCGEPFAVATGEGAWLPAAGSLEGMEQVCFNRATHPASQQPYRGFRSSLDGPALVSQAALEASASALTGFLAALAAHPK